MPRRGSRSKSPIVPATKVPGILNLRARGRGFVELPGDPEAARRKQKWLKGLATRSRRGSEPEPEVIERLSGEKLTALVRGVLAEHGWNDASDQDAKDFLESFIEWESVSEIPEDEVEDDLDDLIERFRESR